MEIYIKLRVIKMDIENIKRRLREYTDNLGFDIAQTNLIDSAKTKEDIEEED
jgi:hypothetical protein